MGENLPINSNEEIKESNLRNDMTSSN